jgi:hypothetical protein
MEKREGVDINFANAYILLKSTASLRSCEFGSTRRYIERPASIKTIIIYADKMKTNRIDRYFPFK